jgi:hypothetical protein
MVPGSPVEKTGEVLWLKRLKEDGTPAADVEVIS